MPTFKQFLVEFPNNTNGVFTPDVPLVGRVLVETSSDITIKRIHLLFRGWAWTSFEESTSYTDDEGNTSSSSITRKGYRSYVSNDLLLFGKAIGSGSGPGPVLKAGRHVFDFTFNFPRGCATSYEGKYGGVSYTMKTIIERNWRPNNSNHRTLVVVRPYDLNEHHHAWMWSPVRSVVAFDSFGVFSQESSIQTWMQISHGGFAAGEQMHIHVDITNSSQSKGVKKIVLNLVQEAKFEANDTSMIQTGFKTVATWSSKEDRKGNFVRDVLLEIPYNVPPTEIHCGIIKLKYDLHLEVSTSGFHSKTLKAQLPLTIGTVPLKNPGQPVVPQQSTSGATFSMEPSAPPLYKFSGQESINPAAQFAGPEKSTQSYKSADSLEDIVKRKPSSSSSNTSLAR